MSGDVLGTDISSFVARRVKDLAPSGIRKFFDLVASTQGVISLSIGEPDFTTPWHIRDSAIQSIKKGYTMYTSNAGMPELKEEIARYLKRNYGLEYDPATQILVTVGVSEALDLAARAIIESEDEVIIPEPCYVAYPAVVNLAGGTPVLVPTDSSTFEPVPEIIEENVTSRTKAILIGSPANPTGAVISRRVLEEIADISIAHNLIVLSDEIYARLIYGAEHVPIASLPGMKERTVLLGGFSKAYAMTGWRIGYAAGNRNIISAMTKIHQYTIMCAPTMGQVGAIEALREADGDVSSMVEDYNRRRLFITNGLREIGLDCPEPKGAFYVFPSIKETGLTSDEFAEKLLTTEKVAVVPGVAFGQSGEGHVRCCYATSLEDIKEALTRIDRFIHQQG